MYKFILFFLMFYFPCCSISAQNIWRFGVGCEINISTNPPAITPSQLTASEIKNNSSAFSEGVATLSKNGSLILYSDGTQIFNRNHQKIPGGDTLLGGKSSTQASLFLPLPNHPTKVLLFTTDDFQNKLSNGLRYSKIDLCGDNQLGSVVSSEKDVLLASSVSEKMCAIKHANGIDYWLLVHSFGQDSFLCFQITQQGISPPVVSEVGTVHENYDPAKPNQRFYENALGMMKFSPNGTKVALAVGNRNDTYVELFDFDNTTGIVSNARIIEKNQNSNLECFYGIVFSENSCNLFVTSTTGKVMFFNTCLSTASLISLSRKIIYNCSDSTVSYGTGGMERASDDVVYVANETTFDTVSLLSQIINASTNPIYHESAVSIPYTQNRLGLSYFNDDIQRFTEIQDCYNTSLISNEDYLHDPSFVWDNLTLFSTLGQLVFETQQSTLYKIIRFAEQQNLFGVYILQKKQGSQLFYVKIKL